MQKIEIKDLKNLSWKSWFMLVTLLLAAGLGGGTVNVMMNVQGEVAMIKDSLQHTINSTFYGLQKPASYIVSVVTSGATTYYCMQNGTTGTLDFWSTNASAVINNASENASLVKGSVFIKAGDYNITNPIQIYNNTKWDGEGYGTHLFLAPNRPNAVGDWPLWCIFWSGGSNYVENVTIQNIRFDGNVAHNQLLGSIAHAVGNVLFFTGDNIRILNNWFESHRNFGLELDGAAGTANPSKSNLVQGNTFIDDQENGLSFRNSIVDSVVSDNYFSGTIGAIALAVSGGNGIVISNNIITNMTGINATSYAHYGIKLESSHNCLVIGNSIKGVRFGIADDTVAGAGNHTIVGNQIWINGINMTSGAYDGYAGISMRSPWITIKSNTIYVGYSSWQIGIDINANNCTINGNDIFSVGIAGDCGGIGSDGNPNWGVYINNVIAGTATAINWNSGTNNTKHNNMENGVWVA